jgi:hypothetical protein
LAALLSRFTMTCSSRVGRLGPRQVQLVATRKEHACVARSEDAPPRLHVRRCSASRGVPIEAEFSQ